MISPDQITTIFHECLLRKDEVSKGRPKCPFLKVDPISKVFEKYRISFNKNRIYQHAKTINAMIDDLPTAFHEGKGSFLQTAMKDRSGRRWTGNVVHAEELLLLGMALDRVELKLARSPKDTFLESAILSIKPNGTVNYRRHKAGGFRPEPLSR